MLIQPIRTNQYTQYRNNFKYSTNMNNKPYDVFFKSKNYEEYDFVSKHHAEYFEKLTKNNPPITNDEILTHLEKISKIKRLEGHNKLNLVEHVITKKANGETRNFDELIKNITFFAKNPYLNSVLIADSAKYILETPDVDMSEFNDILTTVVKNQEDIEPQHLLKTSKILLNKPKERNELIELLKKGLGPNQIKYIALLPDELYSQLKKAKKIEDIDAKYDYFISLKFANQDIYNLQMKNFSIIFPGTKEEADQTITELQKSINTEYPLSFVENKNTLNYENFSKNDSEVLNICKSIIENNKYIEKLTPTKNYQLRAFQSIKEFKHLELEQQLKICKILSAYGHYQESPPPYEAIALILRYKNSFDIFKSILPDCENLNKIENYVNFLKVNTNPIIQDNFDDENYSIKIFEDGTVNKIVEYKDRPNPKVILHSAGIDLARILPNKNNLDKESLLINSMSNKIISASALTEDDYKPFRTYGYIIDSNFDDILGGYPYDIATGYDKDIEHYGANLLKNFSPYISYFPNLIKSKYHLNNIDYLELLNNLDKNDINCINKIKLAENELGATERLDGRKYNEYLLINPIITGLYVYGNLDLMPYELRKFAQDNDLKILHIKSRILNH